MPLDPDLANPDPKHWPSGGGGGLKIRNAPDTGIWYTTTPDIWPNSVSDSQNSRPFGKISRVSGASLTYDNDLLYFFLFSRVNRLNSAE